MELTNANGQGSFRLKASYNQVSNDSESKRFLEPVAMKQGFSPEYHGNDALGKFANVNDMVEVTHLLTIGS